MQLKATETLSNGATTDITSTVDWSSSDASLATVNSSGTVQCLESGTVNISITPKFACTGGCSISGLNGILIAAQFVQSLAVSPATGSVQSGQSIQFKAQEAVINASGSGMVDVTSQAQWTSSTESVATVGASTGLATGVGPGMSSIQATLSGANLPVSVASLTVTTNGVNAPAVSGLSTGTVVTPGSTMQLNLQLPDGYSAGLLYTSVTQTAVARQAPFTVSLTVPVNAIGTIPLIPAGISSSGALVLGSAVSIDVEPATPPTISVTPASLQLSYPGDQTSLAVYGSSGNYAYQYLSPSTMIAYSTQNAAIATVDATGVVTAVSPGTTQLNVAFGTQNASVTVVVPQLIPGDLNANGSVDPEDASILSLFVGQSATTPLDARDLNHDGVINAQDLAILDQLCGAACN